MPEPGTRRVRLIVRGRVQGVGYRWFVRETAASLRLSGWVRNRPDGSVELEAQGTAASIVEFEGRLRTGNPYAKVSAVESAPVPACPGDEGFEITR